MASRQPCDRVALFTAPPLRDSIVHQTHSLIDYHNLRAIQSAPERRMDLRNLIWHTITS